MTTRLAPFVALLALLLAACGSGQNTIDPTPVDGAVSPAPTVGGNGGGSGGVSQSMLDDLVGQASADTGVSADEIEVLAAEAVTWSDGSVGCPEEGMGYTQALVPGFRVMLEVAGERIQYHAAADGEFFPCDNPSEPVGDGTVDR